MINAMTHSTDQSRVSLRALARLQQFAFRANPSVPREHCELCDQALIPTHPHLIQPSSRKILCVCGACALLFDAPAEGRFRRIPTTVRCLDGFRLTDAEWDALLIPINVAFLFASSSLGKVVAIYPSPAGPIESLLTLEAWEEIVENNPVLRSMTADTEALLINRLGDRYGFSTHQYYLAPIDQCYTLVGVMRSKWRGLSGGEDVWQRISQFFSGLADRSIATSAGEHSDAQR